MAFEFPIRVYWEDTDAGGIVFYANYLKFFERARTEWLRSLGIQQSELAARTGCMFVVGDTAIKYHRPARLDDELIVTAALQEAGRATITIRQQAFLKPASVDCTRQLLCEGHIRIGWIDSARWKPARIPSNILEVLQ